MLLNNARGSARASFSVPAAAGFAPEALYLSPVADAARRPLDDVWRLSVLIENAFPAGGGSLVVEVLRVGGDPAVAADWIDSGVSFNAAGIGALVELAAVNGVRLRAQQGGAGAAGAVVVSAWWA